jgi:hypothetical protein
MAHYEPLHCYRHFNVSRYCTVLCDIDSYEPPSCLLWSLTNSIALKGHHVSHPFTTSYGGTWRAWSTGRNCRKENSCNESWNWLTALWGMVTLSNRKGNSSVWDVHNCAYRMVILDSDRRSLLPFRSRSSAKHSQIPRPTRNRTQSSSPAKDASKPVVAASVRRSRSSSNLQHAMTPMTPKCWSSSSHQTAHSSR